MPSLTCLSDLALDDLAGVPHALALVRVGFAELADVRGDLADLLLVDALDPELDRRFDHEADPGGRLDRHRVRVAEGELEVRTLGGDPVADPDDFHRLGVALGDANDHIVDQRAGQAVPGPSVTLVVRPGDHDLGAVLGDRDRLDHGVLQRALRSLDGDLWTFDGDVDARWNGNR